MDDWLAAADYTVAVFAPAENGKLNITYTDFDHVHGCIIRQCRMNCSFEHDHKTLVLVGGAGYNLTKKCFYVNSYSSHYLRIVQC